MTLGTGPQGRWTAPVVAGVAVLVLDQVTKWWALRALSGETIDLFWTIRFRLVYNTGAAFSQGEDLGPVLALLVVAVVILLVRLAARSRDRLSRLVIGAVIGGALSNLADRVFRAEDGLLSGAVVDFVDLQWWPVFNLADAAIVVGGVAIVLRGWRRS